MNEKTINYETGEIVEHADPKAQASLFAKLAKIMGKLERLPKRGRNAHFGYEFVTDADVSDTVRSLLADAGIAFFANMRDAQYSGDKVVARFTFTFADSSTGAVWSCDWVGEGQDKQDKGTAKAATSALKYFLLKTFILSTGDPADDSDNDAPVKPKPAQKKLSAKPARPSGNGTTEVSKAQFFARVLKEIPFYENVGQVTNALKASGYTAYAEAKEAEMLAKLQALARDLANEDAAS